MDATASREAAWNVAKEITDAMFKAVPGTLDVALAYHGSGRLQELTPFSPDAKVFLDKLHTVQCKAGTTAVNEIWGKATEISRLKALIYIGDCFEENPLGAVELAQQLKLKGVRCFIFHDTSSKSQGYNVDTAYNVFQQIAQITGGALLPFDENSPELVKQLLEAIAVYTSLGIKALEQGSNAILWGETQKNIAYTATARYFRLIINVSALPKVPSLVTEISVVLTRFPFRKKVLSAEYP